MLFIYPGHSFTSSLRTWVTSCYGKKLKVNNSNSINKTKTHLLPELIEHKQTTTYDVGNPFLALDRYKNVAELKRLMGFKPSPLDSLISNDNTYINKKTIHI